VRPVFSFFCFIDPLGGEEEEENLIVGFYFISSRKGLVKSACNCNGLDFGGEKGGGDLGTFFTVLRHLSFFPF